MWYSLMVLFLSASMASDAVLSWRWNEEYNRFCKMLPNTHNYMYMAVASLSSVLPILSLYLSFSLRYSDPLILISTFTWTFQTHSKVVCMKISGSIWLIVLPLVEQFLFNGNP